MGSTSDSSAAVLAAGCNAATAADAWDADGAAWTARHNAARHTAAASENAAAKAAKASVAGRSGSSRRASDAAGAAAGA